MFRTNSSWEKKTHHLEKHKTETDMFFSNKRKYKEFIKNNKLIVKTQKNLKQDLEKKGIMFLLKKLIRLLYVQMMIKEWNKLILWKHMYVEQIKIY